MPGSNKGADYVVLGGDKYPVYVWFDGEDAVHITCDDPALVDENGEKPGFRVVFNANPRSADYNPGNRNRLARYLAAAGKSAPEIAQMKPRQLNRRQQVIAELAAEAAGNPMGKAANPETMGWKTCPSCTAVVVDLDKHRTVSSAC